MKNSFIFICILIGFLVMFHQHRKHKALSNSQNEISTTQDSKMGLVKRFSNRHVASLPNSQMTTSFTTGTVLTKSLSERSPVKNALKVSQQNNTTNSSSLKMGEVSTPNSLSSQDLDLLKKIALDTSQRGSKVAYIGELAALYAFDPHFFSQQADQNGQQSWHLQGVDATSSVSGDNGTKNILIQREPYPIPTGSLSNYNLLNRVIVRATDDGANLINIASANVDRSQLTYSIQYAQAHGVVVVNVPPRAISH